MTAPAVHNGSPPAPHSVPAVASGAVRSLLGRPSRAGTVLGASSVAAWLDVGDDVVVVGTRQAVRLPNGVEVGLPDLAYLAGCRATVGGGGIQLGTRALRVTRWWVPRPALPPVTPSDLALAAAALPTTVVELGNQPLDRALADPNPALLADAARGLVGLGEGLTPVGDDYLSAALAAFRLMGPAIGFHAGAAMIDAAAPAIANLAKANTTVLSSSLIRHALGGNVAMPVAELLQALTGRGDVDRAMGSLEGVGHTSGPALVAGVGMGVRSVLQAARMAEEAYR